MVQSASAVLSVSAVLSWAFMHAAPRVRSNVNPRPSVQSVPISVPLGSIPSRAPSRPELRPVTFLFQWAAASYTSGSRPWGCTVTGGGACNSAGCGGGSAGGGDGGGGAGDTDSDSDAGAGAGAGVGAGADAGAGAGAGAGSVGSRGISSCACASPQTGASARPRLARPPAPSTRSRSCFRQQYWWWWWWCCCCFVC